MYHTHARTHTQLYTAAIPTWYSLYNARHMQLVIMAYLWSMQHCNLRVYVYQHTLVGVESDGWLLSSTVS